MATHDQDAKKPRPLAAIGQALSQRWAALQSFPWKVRQSRRPPAKPKCKDSMARREGSFAAGIATILRGGNPAVSRGAVNTRGGKQRRAEQHETSAAPQRSATEQCHHDMGGVEESWGAEGMAGSSSTHESVRAEARSGLAPTLHHVTDGKHETGSLRRPAIVPPQPSLMQLPA